MPYFFFNGQLSIKVLELASISIWLLSKLNIGVGLGFPLGNSHGIITVFPSVIFKVLYSLLDNLNGSKAKRCKIKKGYFN